MPNFPVSQLTSATSVDGTETVPVVQSSTTKKATLTVIANWIKAFFSADDGSSLVGFLQSGTAPISRTVEEVLQATVRSGDFASTANYEARLEALTETIGVSRLNVQTENGIQWETSTAPFVTGTHQNTFNGQIDDVLYLAAYNISPGTVATRIDTSEPYLFISMEAHFLNNAGAHLMEINIDYLSDDGLTQKRFAGFNVDRDTHEGSWAFAPYVRVDADELGSTGYIMIAPKTGATKIANIRTAGGSSEIFQVGGDAAATAITKMQVGYDVCGSATTYTEWSSTGVTHTGSTHGFTGSVTITHSNNAHLTLIRSSGDRFKLGANTAGSGVTMASLNTAGDDFEPMFIQAEYISSNIRTGVNTTTEVLRVASGGLALGTTSFGSSAEKVLSIGTGTAPTTGPADTVQFYSSDNSAGNTIPSFFCEGTEVLATGQSDTTSTTRVKMRINGTVVTLLAE